MDVHTSSGTHHRDAQIPSAHGSAVPNLMLTAGGQKVPVLQWEVTATVTLPPNSSPIQPWSWGCPATCPMGEPINRKATTKALPPCHPPDLDPSDPPSPANSCSAEPDRANPAVLPFPVIPNTLGGWPQLLLRVPSEAGDKGLSSF